VIVVFVVGARYVWATWTTGTFRAMLMVSPFDPDPATQEFVADIVADEMGVAGYARDLVTTPTLVVDGATNAITVDCDDFGFGNAVAGETATYLVVYRFVTNDADSEIVAAFPISRVTDGTALTVTVNASGLLTYGEC